MLGFYTRSLYIHIFSIKTPFPPKEEHDLAQRLTFILLYLLVKTNSNQGLY